MTYFSQKSNNESYNLWQFHAAISLTKYTDNFAEKKYVCKCYFFSQGRSFKCGLKRKFGGRHATNAGRGKWKVIWNNNGVHTVSSRYAATFLNIYSGNIIIFPLLNHAKKNSQ